MGEHPIGDVEYFTSPRMDLNPKWHMETWISTRRIVDCSRTHGALTMFLQGVVELVDYFAWKDRGSPWSFGMD